jgi:hypothetical protein
MMSLSVITAFALFVNMAYAAPLKLHVDAARGAFVEHKNPCDAQTRVAFASVFVDETSFMIDAQADTIELVRPSGKTRATEAYVRGSLYDSSRARAVTIGWPVYGFWHFSTYTLIVRVTEERALEISVIERRGNARCYEKWRGRARPAQPAQPAQHAQP